MPTHNEQFWAWRDGLPPDADAAVDGMLSEDSTCGVCRGAGEVQNRSADFVDCDACGGSGERSPDLNGIMESIERLFGLGVTRRISRG